MATFFSGTDTKTLEQEGNNTNNFVSLIVNNEGTYSAAITRKIKHNKNIKDTYSYELFDTETVTKNKNYTETDTSIEWFYLNVIKPHCSNFNDLNSRLNEIKTTKQKLQDKQKLSYKREQPTAPKSYNNYYYNDFYDDCFFDDYYQNKPFGLKSEVTLDEKQVDVTLKQLLTGSILLSNATTINLKKWANTMVSLYRQRFPRFEEFEDWVDTYADFLLWNYMDKYITEESEPEVFLPILAKSLLSKISILKSNRYLEVFIKTIKKYIKK